MRAPAAAVLALVAILGANEAAADNPDLDRAIELKGRLQYREATAAIEAAIRRGGATPAQLAAMWRISGELAAGLEQADAAVDRFARALAIDPALSLPAGASPKLTGPFDRARARLAGARLAVRPSVDGRTVSVAVDDPLAMAREVRIERTGGEIVASRTAPPYRVTLAGAAAVSLVAIAFDEHGNRLATAGPIAIAASIDVGGDNGGGGRDRPRSIWRGPLPWLAGAALAGAVGGTFGLLALSDQSEVDDLTARARDNPFSVTFEDIEAARDRGRRRALVANVSFAVAGAAAITGGVIWLLGRKSDRVEPTAGGVAVRF